MLLRDPAFRSLKQLLEVHRDDEVQTMSRMMRSIQPSTPRPARRRRRNR